MTRLFVLALLWLATVGTVQAQAVLTVSSWLPATHPVSRVQALWCDEVRNTTAGRVRCRLLASPVADAVRTFAAVRQGGVDVSFGVHGFTPAQFPLTRLVELPLGAGTAEAASVAYQRIYQRHLAALGEHGDLKVIAVFTHGPGHLFTSKQPMASLAQMQGVRVLASGGVVAELGRALGMTVSVRSAFDARESLSADRVDAVFLTAELTETLRLAQLVRYRSSVPGGFYNTSFAMVMNAAAWRRIALADQQAIEGLSGEITARAMGRAWDRADRQALALLQAGGVTMAQSAPSMLADVRSKTAALEQQWLQAARNAGLGNPEAVLRDYRAQAALLE